MRTKWWTCQCGAKQMTPHVPGTPVCNECGAPAPFTVAAPKGQSGFGFLQDGDEETNGI